MNANKFLKWMGLLFVGLGAVMGIGMLVGGAMAREGLLIGIGVMFLAVFCGVGGLLAKIGISTLRREQDIAEQGTAVMGKIFDYVPDYQYTVNGSPTLSLIVRYKQDGIIRQATVRTGQPDTAEFPRGATVTISILNGEAVLIPGSISDTKLPDEENLLNPDIDPEKIHASIGAACPACGANLTVPVGMSAICPYCGRKVVAGRDGSVR